MNENYHSKSIAYQSEIAMKPDPDPGTTRVGALTAYATALLATLAALATSLGGACWGPVGP